MKRWALALVLVWNVQAHSSETRTEVQFGFPNLLALRLDRPITPRWRIGITGGWLPVSLLSSFLPQVTSDFSDEYDIALRFNAHALTTGVFAEWRAFERAFLRFEILVNTVDALAKTYISNKSTGVKAPYMDFEATAVLPRLAITYGFTLSRSETSTWLAGLGATIMLPKTVFVQRQGPASAYYDAVPSVRDSMQDGIDTAQTDLSGVLSNTFAGTLVLPALWVSAAW